MKIRTLPVEDSPGHLLVHNVADGDGRKLLKKGSTLSLEDVATLRGAGYDRVDVAMLDEGDVHEDQAAARIAAALVDGAARRGLPLRATRAVGGRVNLHVDEPSVLYVNPEQLAGLNLLPGVALATRPRYSVLGADRSQLATLKVIPYALPAATVAAAEALAADLLHLAPLPPARIALLVTAEAGAAARLQQQFERPTGARLTALGSTLATVETVAPDEATIAAAADRLLASHDALVIGGQTSIMDPGDTTPRALARLGAEVALHGAPVEPGNLLALAYRDAQWILCAPGCARSPAPNVVDLVLPRLLAGERLGPGEIAEMGLGGLL